MPRLTADVQLCQGYGNCLTHAADVYDLDDDGKVVLLTDSVEERERARILEATLSCPVSALGMTD